MSRTEVTNHHPLYAADSGSRAAGANQIGEPVLGGFERPGYFDNGTTAQMQEGLERLVQDPAFRSCVGSLSVDETAELFQRQAEIEKDTAIDLIKNAVEQQIIRLFVQENEQWCDRFNIVLLGTFLTDKGRTAKIVKSKNFVPFIGQVVRELGSHRLAEELTFLIPPEDQPSVEESAAFEGYSFPGEPPKFNGIKAKLQERRRQGQ